MATPCNKSEFRIRKKACQRGHCIKNRAERKTKPRHPDKPNQSRGFRIRTDSIKKRLIEPIKAYGYLEPKLTYSLSNTNNDITINYNIELGRPTIIRKFIVNISGDGKNDTNILKLKKYRDLQPGKVFSTESYAKFLLQIQTTTSRQGYFNKEITNKKRIIINQKKHSAEIIINIDTGKRYVIGSTSLPNNTYFSKVF